MDTNAIDYTCEYCRKSFPCKKTRNIHVLRVHKRNPKFICQQCGLHARDNFQYNNHLKSHLRVVQTRGNVFSCPECVFTCKSKNIISYHYRTVHKYDLSTREILFSDLSSFQAWKVKFSQDSDSQFTAISRNAQSNKTVLLFYCHRDGFYKPEGNNIRQLKIKGSNKMNAHCPAYIKATIRENGQVQVTYCENHVGHDKDVGRLSLTNAEKTTIAEKMKLKIPFSEIIRQMREQVPITENIKRIHLLTNRDLHNISQQFNMKEEADPQPEYSSDDIEQLNKVYSGFVNNTLSDNIRKKVIDLLEETRNSPKTFLEQEKMEPGNKKISHQRKFITKKEKNRKPYDRNSAECDHDYF